MIRFFKLAGRGNLAQAEPEAENEGPDDQRRYAVVDIGSNSIRLVVYQGITRAPLLLFNEKVMCGLGRGIARSGRLNDEGVAMALANLARFRALVGAMRVAEIEVLATAAVREAANGPDFIAEVKRVSGLDVRVISGGEEAQLSALGVLSATPDADGVVGDLGGGSLELVDVSNGVMGAHVTLPLGPLRLSDMAEGSIRRARTIVDKQLRTVDWLDRLGGRTFYAVGGAWRMLARLFMELEDYPLHIIHHYELSAERVGGLLTRAGRIDRDSLKSLPNLSRRRFDTLPWASLVLSRLFQVAGPSSLAFSAFGLREGCLFQRLSRAEQARDPLLAGCATLIGRGRFELEADELGDFMSVLLADVDAQSTRLAYAACILSDIAWTEHPDYRAAQAYRRVLLAPLIGVDHRERAFLALAIAVRYGAVLEELPDRVAAALLSPESIKLATEIGLALRLGYILSGGAPGVLGRAWLGRVSDGGEERLVLRLPTDGSMVPGDAVNRRVEALGRSLGVGAAIEVGPPAR